MQDQQSKTEGLAAVALHSLVQRHGRTRINAYQEYDKKYCSSDASMRRLMRKKMPTGMKFQRAKYPVGSVVRGTMWPGLYLVVGHSFTGSHGQERGCVGCKITDRIYKKWQWVGPDKTLTPVPLNDKLSHTAPTTT